MVRWISRVGLTFAGLLLIATTANGQSKLNDSEPIWFNLNQLIAMNSQHVQLNGLKCRSHRGGDV